MEPRIRYGVSVLLTWISGYVDAIGWLSYRHIYTANMSGNSVGLGIQTAAGDWGEAVLRAWPVAMYTVGLVACRIGIEAAARYRLPRIAWLMFLTEVALLGAAMAGAPGLFGGIALLALAMGIQNATLTKFGGMTLYSGFVTGTLVKFSEQFSAYLSWLGRGRSLRASLSQRSFRYSVWMVAVWIAYVVGAIAGAFADRRWALPALLVPVLALTGLASYDFRTPLAVADEQQQLRNER